MNKVLVLATALFAAASFAETTTTVKKVTKVQVVETTKKTTPSGSVGTSSANVPATTTTGTITGRATGPTIMGDFDFRPSWTANNGKMHTETFVELGVKPTPDTQISYSQGVLTNVFTPTPVGATEGLNAKGLDGYLRGKVNNVWKSGPLSLSSETRLFAPTDPARRNQNFVTALRQYAKLKYDVTPTFSLTFMELPTGIVHSTASANGQANPWFENRVYLIGDVNISKDLTFSLPVMFHQTKHRAAAGATNSDAWTYWAWIYPELLYSVAPGMQVGVSYYSDNLVKADLSGLSLGTGLHNGITQAVLRYAL